MEQPAASKAPERRELPELAKLAIREANKNADTILGEIIMAAGKSLGLDEKDWRFDPQTMSFVRSAP